LTALSLNEERRNGTHLLAVVRLALLVILGYVSGMALRLIVDVAVLLVLRLVLGVVLSVALLVVVMLAFVFVDGLVDGRVLRVALWFGVTVALVGLGRRAGFGCRPGERKGQGRESQQKSPLKI
jgi:hypothetical protein